MKKLAVITFALACWANGAFAESYQSKALRALLSDPLFPVYISKNEDANHVKLTGIRVAEGVVPKEGEKIFWNLDFVGGVKPEFAKIICMGSALSSDREVEVRIDMPVECRIIRFTE